MGWRPCLSLAVGLLLCADIVLSAQTWPTIAPIPLQERFRPRSDLKIALHPKTSRLAPGELPSFTLEVRNVGRRAVRISSGASTNANVSLRVFDASGQPHRSTINCTYQRIVLLASVRTYPQLVPGQSRMFLLDQPCGGLPELPAGDYQFEATYYNYPDAPGAYDVYEAGASDVWDGSIVSPRASIKVLSLDRATEQSLIALVDRGESAGDVREAIRRLGLGGSANATPALIRRFEREPAARPGIARALVQIPDPDAAAALGAAVDRLPSDERAVFNLTVSTAGEDGYLPLVRRAPGCGALPLVMNLNSQREEAVRLLDVRCADLRARLVSASQTPSLTPRTPETNRVAERAMRAASLLQILERPPATHTPAQSDDEFRDIDRPDPAAVEDFLRDVIGNERPQSELAVKGLARFGTAADFVRVKDTFASRDEKARGWLEDVLVLMSFVSDRDGAAIADPAYWNAWWKSHEGMGRDRWAREALQRGMLRTKWVTHDQAPSRAAEFLLATQGLSPALMRELSQHRSYLVRLALADAVSAADERSGARLYMRELSNRYIAACIDANQRLEQLTRTRFSGFQLDCADPGERQRAIAHWTKLVDGMEPGFLPLTVARLAQ